MKKIIVLIGALFVSFASLAADTATTEPAKIEEGKQYITLPKYASADKEVIEFFSFNCGSCYLFDNEFQGPQTIEKNLPESVPFNKYHLENFGPLAKELSEAWAIATVLDIREPVSTAIYNAVHKTRSLKTASDIRNIFINLGVDGDKFDNMKNNFLVQAFMAQQRAAANELQPSSIPAVVVNGKYLVNSRGLDPASNEATITDFSRVVNYLTEKK